MDLENLRLKHIKARSTYLKYRDINQTNNIEKQHIPEAREFLCKHYDEVFTVKDSFLNYIGADFICNTDDTTVCVDMKVCRNCGGFDVMIDAFKKGDNGLWENVRYQKITDFFLFINRDAIFYVDANIIFDKIDKLTLADTEFLPRDKKETCRKAIVTLAPEDRIFAVRRAKN